MKDETIAICEVCREPIRLDELCYGCRQHRVCEVCARLSCQAIERASMRFWQPGATKRFYAVSADVDRDPTPIEVPLPERT